MNKIIIVSVALAAAAAATGALGADKAIPRPRPAPSAARAPMAAHALLSPAEAASIGAVLHAAAGSAAITCGGPWCHGLADSLSVAFIAAGWTVRRGSAGGVPGIHMSYCAESGRKIRDAIGASRAVDATEETNCNVLVDREVRVAIGPPR